MENKKKNGWLQRFLNKTLYKSSIEKFRGDKKLDEMNKMALEKVKENTYKNKDYYKGKRSQAVDQVMSNIGGKKMTDEESEEYLDKVSSKQAKDKKKEEDRLKAYKKKLGSAGMEKWD